LEVSKKGLPLIWEYGGGSSYTGCSRVVAGKVGERLKPIYIKRSDSCSNGEYALFIAFKGMVVIKSYHYNRDFTHEILRVKKIEKILCNQVHTVESSPCFVCEDRGWNYEATLKLEAKLSRGKWSAEVPEYLGPALTAGIKKALCYYSST